MGTLAENDHTAEKPGACPRASDRVRTHAPTLVSRRRVTLGLPRERREKTRISPLADANAACGEIILTVKHTHGAYK